MKKTGVLFILLMFFGIFSVLVVAQTCFLPCTVTEECNGDQTCTDGCCIANNCQVPCTSDAECTLDHTCNGVCCVPISCTVNSDCPTPCPEPTAYSPASTFFLMQCNYCQFGFCVDPPPLCAPPCNDMNPCTTDACIGPDTCSFTPNSDPCDDGLFCTVSDTCSGGSCSIFFPQDCSDSFTCTVDSCTEAMGGKCVHTPDDSACDDGVACTDDECDMGGPPTGCANTPDDGLCTFSCASCTPGDPSNGVDGCSCDSDTDGDGVCD